MDEKDLLFKLKDLNRIKPEKRWVKATKREILGPLFPIFQPILIGSLLLLVGVFVFAQKSLPGERLYTIKRITERTKTFFVSENEKPKLDLELANKRLEELRQIAQKNDVRKLAPALKEVRESTSQLSKSLKKVGKLDPEIVVKTQKLEKNKEITQKILGTKIETEELENTYKVLAEREIKNLENSSLTERQAESLNQAKDFFEKGDYLNALAKAIEASQIK